jgi:adenine phosphoribosyltransferase
MCNMPTPAQNQFTALEESRLKILSIDCLKAIKAFKTFRVLSKEIALPPGVINRYIHGYVLPKTERAEKIVGFFIKNYLPKLLESAKGKSSRYIVTADLLSQPFLLNVIAFQVRKSFSGILASEKVDAVLTAAVDGVPLASAIANQLNCHSIYAKRTQEISFSDHYVSKARRDRPTSVPFYLPKSLLKRNDNVIIVDDVIRAGTTFDALVSICSQAKATVAGIFAVFITGSAYKELRKSHPVHYLVLIDD